MKLKIMEQNYKRQMILSQRGIYNLKFCVLFLLCLFFTVRPLSAVILLAFGIAFLDTTKIRIKRINNDRRYMILFGFWLYCFLISLAWETWNQSINLTMLYRISWIIILIRVVTMNKDYISLIQTYKKIMIVCACFGIIEYLTKISTWSLLGLHVTGNLQYGAHRISVIFYNPLVYSAFLLIAFWSEWCYPCKQKILHYLMVGLFAVNMILTEARSAWVALVCGMVVFVLPRIKRIRLTARKFLYGFFTVIVLAGVGYLCRERLLALMEVIFLRLGSTSIREGSYIQRTGVIKNAFDFFVHNSVYFLTGGGYGYAGIFIREHPVVLGFHAIDNQYIYYLLNYGVVGTALFLKATFWKSGYMLHHLGNINCRFSILCMMTIACSYFFFDAMSWPSFFICYALTWGAIIMRWQKIVIKIRMYRTSEKAEVIFSGWMRCFEL